MPIRMVLVCQVYSFGSGLSDELGGGDNSNQAGLIEIINNIPVYLDRKRIDLMKMQFVASLS